MNRVLEYMQELSQPHRVSYYKLIRMSDFQLSLRYSSDERKDIGMFYGIEATRRTSR